MEYTQLAYFLDLKGFHKWQDNFEKYCLKETVQLLNKQSNRCYPSKKNLLDSRLCRSFVPITYPSIHIYCWEWTGQGPRRFRSGYSKHKSNLFHFHHDSTKQVVLNRQFRCPFRPTLIEFHTFCSSIGGQQALTSLKFWIYPYTL